jgi:Cys-tRNA(Pro)/Cys-tRNA(Cys) deacylase
MVKQPVAIEGPVAAVETRATRALRALGVSFRTRVYDPAITTGLEAARALAIEPSCLFKSLVLRCADGLPVLALVPVSRKLDLRALAKALGTQRCALADQSMAEKATGSRVGEISPFGLRAQLRTVIDESAFACSTVYVSGGTRGLELEMEPRDLIKACQGITGAIAT